jgi:hypothetical protein
MKCIPTFHFVKLSLFLFTLFQIGFCQIGHAETFYFPPPINEVIAAHPSPVAAGNICGGTVKSPIYNFQITVSGGTPDITGFTFTTTGTYLATDVTKFQLWTNTSNNFATATQLSTDITTTLGPAAHPFAAFIQTTPAGTYYYWVTADISAVAVNARTLAVSAIASANITVSTGTKSGTAPAAGTQTVLGLPAITAQPGNAGICTGNNASFSVTATGGGLSYQWRENGVNLSNSGVYSNVTTATLNLTAPGAGLSGRTYDCIVSGTCGPAVTSNAATLSINSAPAITAQPVNSTICSGNNTSFSVTATGGGLSYQWRENGVNLANGGVYSNVTTATMNITGAGTGLNGKTYDCIVTGSCAPVLTSLAATLTVNLSITISVQPSNTAICSGNASFSVTATGAGLTYQWRENGVNLSNGGVYSNVTTATLNLTSPGVSLNGKIYDCVLSGTCPSVTSAAGTLTINSAPAITVQPSNAIACGGGNAAFSVTATGTGLTYQWRENGVNLANGGVYSNVTTATLNLTAPGGALNGKTYSCVITGTCAPPVTSASGTLTVSAGCAPVITTQPVNKIGCTYVATSFSLVASGAGLTYQWRKDGVNLTNGGIEVYSGVTTATLSLCDYCGIGLDETHAGNYDCIVSGTIAPPCTSNVATLTLNPPVTVTVHPSPATVCPGATVQFKAAGYGSLPGGSMVYQWYEDPNVGNLISNGGIYSGATTSTLTLTGVTSAYNGKKYYCYVQNTNGPSCYITQATNAALLSVGGSVTIAEQPTNQSVYVGNNATFRVLLSTATGIYPTGSPAATYQWRENGVNLSNGGVYSNVNTPVLVLEGVGLGLNGKIYDCVIGGCSSSTTSTAATLTVAASTQNYGFRINSMNVVISGGTSAAPVYLCENQSGIWGFKKTSATAGNIVSEGQYNYLKWNLGSGPNGVDYIIPFGKTSSVSQYIPFTIHKNSGTGDMFVSTKATPNTNMPHFSPINYMTGAEDSITSALDRFWSINTTGALNCDITFSYLVAENTTTTNPTGLTMAQRWNAASNAWDPPIGPGTNGLNSGSVGTVKADGISTFSSWILSRAATPLPIELLDFNASCCTDNGEVDLYWVTATETNNDYFTVERSIDGNNFSQLTIVDGAGNSTVRLNYSTLDPEPENGLNYYRLKQTDFDGNYTYSNVVAVENKNSNGLQFNIYPNPSVGQSAYMSIEGLVDEAEILVVVYDVWGQESYSKVIIADEDSENIIAIDPSGKLPAGIYFVKATSGQTTYQQKMIISGK